jgi:hypothetical protein
MLMFSKANIEKGGAAASFFQHTGQNEPSSVSFFQLSAQHFCNWRCVFIYFPPY